jgi:hypothetical protein
MLEAGLGDLPGLTLIPRPADEAFVGSSFQFLLPDWPADKITGFLAGSAQRGVELKWFGGPEPVGFTSAYRHWHYAAPDPLPKTDRILAGLIDMRVPLTFSLDDCAQIARILRAEVTTAFQSPAPASQPAPGSSGD